MQTHQGKGVRWRTIVADRVWTPGTSARTAPTGPPAATMNGLASPGRANCATSVRPSGATTTVGRSVGYIRCGPSPELERRPIPREVHITDVGSVGYLAPLGKVIETRQADNPVAQRNGNDHPPDFVWDVEVPLQRCCCGSVGFRTIYLRQNF
jgi:hypothetical protein